MVSNRNILQVHFFNCFTGNSYVTFSGFALTMSKAVAFESHMTARTRKTYRLVFAGCI